MDNVIRPAFGRPPELEREPRAAAVEHRPLRVYGAGAGHVVALIRSEDGPEGPALHVVIGKEKATTVETVAVLLPTSEGETDAEVIAMAILRVLEVIEANSGAVA